MPTQPPFVVSLSNHEVSSDGGATTSFDKLRTNGWVLPLLMLLALLWALPAWAAPQFPKLTGRVVDAANILPPATEAALDAKLAGLEQRDGTQLVVATVPSLQDYDIADYGYQLGRAWGIGQKGKNNGAILLVAPNERKVRIEVGYGLEPVLTDAMTSVIIQQTILPRFKAGDMAGGIEAGADAVIAQLGLTPEEAQAAAQRAAEAQAARSRDGGGSGISGHAFIWLIVIFFWIIPAIFRRRGRRYRSGIGGALPTILWAASQAGRSRGGGWGGGGFGGGGGGFSGGGGSFGGGGSSGSW